MNLNTYDNIREKLDKTKTWVDIKRKQLISREIKYRPYYCILTRFNPKTNIHSYYLAVLDKIPTDKMFRHTNHDDYGRVKINLSDIWKKTYLNNIKSDINIECKLVEEDNDGEVYYLDV